MKNIKEKILSLLNITKDSMKDEDESNKEEKHIEIISENIRKEENLSSNNPDERSNENEKKVEMGEITKDKSSDIDNNIVENIARQDDLPKINRYCFPPHSILKQSCFQTVDSAHQIKETAILLQQTLRMHGISVNIVDIIESANFTRFEIELLQTVSVKKILNLYDDIKMNLCATDINIIAPIPGKSTIGIDVTNKERKTIFLRDLLESKEFKEFPSNLAFAVGKDVNNNVVIADIAQLPNMIIGGTTGSGKSVFIDTIIMSILYKAHPDDVRMILIDTKAVNMSIYNGIPHLLIPVITNPIKALTAIHWAISEAKDRYFKFSDCNARDLKEYNTISANTKKNENSSRLPQILIIIDDFSDVMSFNQKEMEESLADLARISRAAGIHVIIATQRPSSDVVTGLIKVNIPSRIAFKVFSSGDSKTIIEEVGAEKLFGAGDMLFYPQGYSKPARIQSAFVSDKEVGDVVDFLKHQLLDNAYTEEIAQIKNIGRGDVSGGDDRDEYFAEAGRIIIENEKASIGILQRVLKIGFNRAAKIMDQLAEYDVVGEEEGTKPRMVLMSLEQFELLLDKLNL